MIIYVIAASSQRELAAIDITDGFNLNQDGLIQVMSPECFFTKKLNYG